MICKRTGGRGLAGPELIDRKIDRRTVIAETLAGQRHQGGQEHACKGRGRKKEKTGETKLRKPSLLDRRKTVEARGRWRVCLVFRKGRVAKKGKKKHRPPHMTKRAEALSKKKKLQASQKRCDGVQKRYRKVQRGGGEDRGSQSAARS